MARFQMKPFPHRVCLDEYAQPYASHRYVRWRKWRKTDLTDLGSRHHYAHYFAARKWTLIDKITYGLIDADAGQKT